jgi:WD40 repeat protein
MDGNGTTIVWNVATRRQVMTLEGTLSPDNTASVTPEVAFSPDGRTILTVNDTARLWNAATHRSVATIPGTVTSAAFSPDGDTLAATDYDGPINLWRYAGS